MIVNLNRECVKLLKWAQKACWKNIGREALKATNFNGHVEACDGVRIHAANMLIPVSTFDPAYTTDAALNGLFVVPKALNIGVCNLEPSQETYPNIAEVLPKGEPMFEICVNAKFLVDALSGLDDYARLVFYPHHVSEHYDETVTPAPIEVYGKIEDVEVYALIMPAHIAYPSTWKPERKE